jgi:predicted ATPase
MPAYILTGAPGSGKTAVLRLLETLGYAVVEEAATDVIALRQAQGCAEPWREPSFIDEIIALQQRRQDAARPTAQSATIFLDRSLACTLALSRYLDLPEPPLLGHEITRLLAGGAYEASAFFIRNQGFVQATDARRISFQDSLTFERLHEQAYQELGFQLVEVPAGPLADRVAVILKAVSQLG